MGYLSFSVQFAPSGHAGGGGQGSTGRREPLTEREVLLQLYAETGGPAGTWRETINWGSNQPLAEWFGVFVDAAGHVESLILAGNGLQGPLPADLGELPGMRTLDLYGNRLLGTIPATLGKLNQLTFLDLSHNALTGPIPATLAELARLRVLQLDHNQLVGPVPAALGELPALETLRLGENRLAGPFPVSWQRIAHLELTPQHASEDP